MRILSLGVVALLPLSAWAGGQPGPGDGLPSIGYSWSAFGARARTAGAMGFAVTSSAGDGLEIAGGGRLWLAPIDRLTLAAQVDRSLYGEAAPSVTVALRLVGHPDRGVALASGLTWKAEGFASPEELAGELEGALMLSVAAHALHLDANGVVGVGLEGDEAGGPEVDAEARLRLGYDVAPRVRLGLDGRLRRRLNGDRLLPGGRRGDVVVGPDVLVRVDRYFLAASAGPSTVGVASGAGWSAWAAFGGTMSL